MNLENRLWQVLLILVGLLTVFVPAYVAYDIYGRGPLPKKRIELDVQPSINVMRDLSGLRENVALSLRIQGEPTDNLIVVKAFLKNVGETPILPPEFYENISVNVKKPWRILAVGNSKELNSDIQFSWKRVNDLRFEAEPALLNPGDRVATTIYTQLEK